MRPAKLTDIPTWNQNRDPLPDGEASRFPSTECGEECAAMRIYYRTGIALPADTLRQLIPAHSDHGETTGQELVDLMRLFDLRPVLVLSGQDAIQSDLVRSISRGTPPIVLGYWDSGTVLHWVLGVGSSSTGLLVNDPWDGSRRWIPWDVVLRGYAGSCIL